MKNTQILIGSDTTPIKPDVVIVLKNHELAVAVVGEYKLDHYGMRGV